MISKRLRTSILSMAERYPQRESALVPALQMIQRENDRFLSREDLKSVAALFSMSESKVFGVASYYTLLNLRPRGKYHLQVDTNIPAMLAGAEKILSHLMRTLGIEVGETTVDGMFSLSAVEDLASCGTCPVIQVNDVYYENMSIEKTDALLESLGKSVMPVAEDCSAWASKCSILLKHRARTDGTPLVAYKADGGYGALAKARLLEPEEIVRIVTDSNLLGRGGGGFPAGTKWRLLPKDRSQPVYLICNADEGEPGTFKDRQIMQYDPHLLVEGIAIAARAVGATKAFIYIRGEFSWIAQILERTVAEAGASSDVADLDIIVHQGAGSYICGEETALIESLEGKRGCPRIKPPFPAGVGLYGCPTIVNNVETLSLLPFIIEHGANAFRRIGTDGNFGPKLFGICGHVNRPGVYEYPLGTPLAELLQAAGGAKGNLKAVFVGGLSVPVLTAAEATDLRMDFQSCIKAGTMLGSGGIIVMNDSVWIPDIALRAIRFYVHESCGQCTPCREGGFYIEKRLARIAEGRGGAAADIDAVLGMCDRIMGLSLCPSGNSIATTIRSMVQKFRGEFDSAFSMRPNESRGSRVMTHPALENPTDRIL
jgi:NADH:ubiquinone oxidoreductase subunit F (NADH-binding)/NADH:ubiquinone oxidoreductase subunit E